MRLALFDLDNTLLPIDSDYAWGEFTSTIGWTDAHEFNRKNDEFYTHYKAGTLDIHEYVRFATAAVRAHSPAEAAAAHQRFMREVITPVIKVSALDLVEQHRARGEQLMIVTATNEFVTRPIASAFGISELIAVELERDAAGRLTGEIRGEPSFRAGKVKRLDQWLAVRGLSWDALEHSTFYSDSINDLALLERVREPVAANPDPALRAIAAERGWRILELFGSSA